MISDKLLMSAIKAELNNPTNKAPNVIPMKI